MEASHIIAYYVIVPSLLFTVGMSIYICFDVHIKRGRVINKSKVKLKVIQGGRGEKRKWGE